MWNSIKGFWRALDDPMFSDEWTVKRVMGTAIFVIFFLAFVSRCQDAYAATEMIYQEGGLAVTLTAESCSDPTVLRMIDPEKHDIWRKAVVFFEGRTYGACYTPISYQGEMVVLVLDESGDSGVVPLDAFRNKSDVTF
jgi:hypothetical protein